MTLPPLESMLLTRMAPLVSVSVISPLVDADIWPVAVAVGLIFVNPVRLMIGVTDLPFSSWLWVCRQLNVAAGRQAGRSCKCC